MDIQIIALLVAPTTAIVALLYGVYLVRKVFRKPEGTPDMVAISQAIREGASAYIKKQFTVILPLVVILAAILVFATKPLSVGLGTALAFLVGAVFSGLAGHFGMWVATRANVRVTEAAKKGLLNPPLTIAFAGGTVNGMLIVGLGLLGVSIIYIIFRGQATDVLVGFGFGAALLALFMRVGGGIYTKAADVGADLVGKIEAGIPEDDPRNAAVIADNVGDNVGDCAGMGADVFESYAVTIVAAMILGHLMFGIKGVVFPLLARSAGIISSILGTLIVKAKSEEEHPMTPIFKGFALSAVLAAVFFGLFAYFILGNPVVIQDVGAIAKGTHYTWWQILLAAMVGLATTVIIGWWTNYYTSTEAKPVREIAKSAQTGAATNIITGLAFGMESSVAVISMVAAAVVISYFLAGPYGIALCGMGMLAPTGIIMSMDSFGPIADNAAGIAEMTGVLKGKAEKIMISLDAVGNTTKALTKGFAISSAAVAAVALFQTFVEKGHILRGIQINQPLVLVGLFLGGALPFLFSSLTIKAVGRTAFKVVEEVRRQFREIKGLMEGKAKPEYARCVSIVTDGAIRELIVPALVVVILPVAVGFILGAPALGAFLGGAILVAQLMAVFQSNVGGAWDNAKKYIEDGHLGGKGTPTHAAAVTGDTVGDPLKDTSGPALNPMIKVVNIVALLVAPLLTSIGSLLK